MGGTGSMVRRCSVCPYGESLRYADGHNSIRCTHPSLSERTTRDIHIIGKCPKEKDKDMDKGCNLEYGQIVLHKGRPALVVSVPTNGRSVTLMLAKNDFKTVLKEDISPYDGEGDAVSLGFRDAQE